MQHASMYLKFASPPSQHKASYAYAWTAKVGVSHSHTKSGGFTYTHTHNLARIHIHTCIEACALHTHESVSLLGQMNF